MPLRNRRDVVALRLDGDAIALRLAFRDIDVEKRAHRQRPLRSIASASRRRGPRPLEKSYAPRVERSDTAIAGHAEQRAFERARHRPRIGHVVAEVVALVDAGHHEVWQSLEHLRDRNVDAVGRRAIDTVNADRAIDSSRSGCRSVSA